MEGSKWNAAWDLESFSLYIVLLEVEFDLYVNSPVLISSVY